MGILRNVVVKIGADITALQNGLNQAQQAMQNAGKKLSSIGKDLAIKVSLPLVGIGGAMIKSAADFEQALSNIKAVSGSTAKEMESFKNLALEMGAKTKYSAVEAASGIEELIKAGVNTKDILNGGLAGALSLATAGDLELAESAEIASTALNSFKADGLNMTTVANLLAGGANAAATSVQELKFGLSQVSAVASGVGMSFEDTVTTLSLFSNNGLKGSDAGTSLKTMLMRLQPSTKEQTKLFEKLNLINEKGQSVFFNTAGKLKSIADIAGILQNRLKGMTDAQRLQTMETMFGSDAIRASNILYKEGAEGINNLKTEMSKVTAEEVGAEKLNNFNGALEQLKGSLETLGITLGMILLPHLTNLANHLTELTNKFAGIDPNIQKTILVIGGIAAAIAPVLIIVGQVINGFGALAGAVSALLTPVGLVVVALAGLTAGFIYLYNTNADFKAKVLDIWEQIKVGLQIAFEAIKSVAMVVFDSLKAFWSQHGNEVMAVLQNVWNVIKTALTAVWNIISTVAMAVFGGLQTFWKNHSEDVKNALTTAWSVIWSILQPIWNTILSVAQTVFGFLAQFFAQNGETIKRIFTNAFELIYQVITVVCGALKAFWTQWGGVITAYFKGIWDVIKVIFQTAWDLIKVIVQTAVDLIDGIIRLALNLIKGNWQGVWESICDIAKTVWNAITGVIKAAINGLMGYFTAMKDGVLGIFNGMLNGIKSIVNGIIGVVNSMISAVNSINVTVPDWIPGVGGKSIGFNLPRIPMLANGGIIDRPTLSMVGEGTEPEAVIPLSKLDNMISGSGDTIIHLELDSEIIATIINRKIGQMAYSIG